MDNLRISLLQTAIVWEDKRKNLDHLHSQLKTLRGTTDLVVLPEMFSTGFTMNSASLAEPVTGETITLLKQWASNYELAIAGSYIASEDHAFYNRAFFITPGEDTYFYDKRHLFRMGDEPHYFSAGNKRIIIPYLGWNICILICYDLRFPAWSRNIKNEYDLLLYVANWPASRQKVWDTLLPARALENMSYVCGVNRIGTDGNDLSYTGGSVLYSPKGKLLASIPENKENTITTEINLTSLQEFREKFPVWKDADVFEISGVN